MGQVIDYTPGSEDDVSLDPPEEDAVIQEAVPVQASEKDESSTVRSS